VPHTRGTARSFTGDVCIVTSDDEYRDDAYVTIPALAVTLRGKTPKVSLDVARTAAEIAVVPGLAFNGCRVG
jgi:hypothetical protein